MGIIESNMIHSVSWPLKLCPTSMISSDDRDTINYKPLSAEFKNTIIVFSPF